MGWGASRPRGVVVVPVVVVFANEDIKFKFAVCYLHIIILA